MAELVGLDLTHGGADGPAFTHITFTHINSLGTRGGNRAGLSLQRVETMGNELADQVKQAFLTKQSFRLGVLKGGDFKEVLKALRA